MNFTFTLSVSSQSINQSISEFISDN